MKVEKHVALYLRISQHKEEKDDTLTNHRTRLVDFCKENRWSYEEFSEVTSGGTSNLDKRPQLKLMLENLERFDAIVVIELSRLARNGLVSEIILEKVIEHDIPILTPDGDVYDLRNDDKAVLMYRFGSLISADEHKRIGRRSLNNKKTMAREGKWIAGEAPYAYRINKETKKLEVIPDQADVVKMIYQDYQNGELGITGIATKLNDLRIPSKRGGKWTGGTVKKILANPAYFGQVVFQVKEKIRGKEQIVETIIVDNAHEPIVSRNTFDAVNVVRGDKTRHHKRRLKANSFLKNVLHCGSCGRKLSMCVDRGHTLINTCNTYVDGQRCGNSGMYVKPVEEEVIRLLREHKKLVINTLRDTDLQSSDMISKRKEQVIEGLKRNEAQMRQLVDFALDGIFTKEQVIEKQNQLTDEKTRLTALLEELEDTQPIQDRLQRILNLYNEGFTTVIEQVVYKVYFTRLIPEDIKKLSPMNPIRKHYPFNVEIEFIEF